jgi:hypothetical protein
VLAAFAAVDEATVEDALLVVDGKTVDVELVECVTLVVNELELAVVVGGEDVVEGVIVDELLSTTDVVEADELVV